jgi:nicotine blue oxidoreductase
MAADPAKVVCAVLAAGSSSRMGRPKALVEVDGERALERVLRIARTHGMSALVVLGAHEREIRAAVPLRGARVLVNPAPERGQSSSVKLAAQAVAPEESLALWPVDHARVREETVARLLEAFQGRPDGIELVVPSHGGRRGHPLFSSPAAVRELANLAEDEPAHAVVRRDPDRVLHVSVADPAVVEDFDRPEDLRPRDDPTSDRRAPDPGKGAPAGKRPRNRGGPGPSR